MEPLTPPREPDDVEKLTRAVIDMTDCANDWRRQHKAAESRAAALEGALRALLTKHHNGHARVDDWEFTVDECSAPECIATRALLAESTPKEPL